MGDEMTENCQKQKDHQSGGLKQAVETLRTRFSSVKVETSVVDDDTALNVRFLGDQANIEERHLLVTNLAQCLPPALSILGISAEQKQCGEKETLGKDAS